MHYDSKKPDWEERDRLVLSCGHICPVLYATLAHAGYFSHDELKTLRKINSKLQGHPHFGDLPGVEVTSGPLGQGYSQAVGMALAGMIDDSKKRIFCVSSDGEHNEGQTWEAVMLAAKYKLHNLTTLLDRNNIQIDGYTEDIMPLEPLKEKYEAFNWHVIEVNGHSIQAVIDAVNLAKTIFEKPSVIICHTIAGKGVEFMEGEFEWHGIPPSKKEAKIAIRDIRTLGGKIYSEHD
jgi:transketolase